MSEPFIAEIRMWGLNFAPRGWAFCNGQLLPIAQNAALFSLIGTIYGGDGRTTTALPNLEDRMPMHPGRGPGLTQRSLGQRVGASTVALTENQMPPHRHSYRANGAFANKEDPANEELAAGHQIYSTTAGSGSLNAATVNTQGGGQAHNNQSPYQGLNFTIALQGLFPSRN